MRINAINFSYEGLTELFTFKYLEIKHLLFLFFYHIFWPMLLNDRFFNINHSIFYVSLFLFAKYSILPLVPPYLSNI